MTALWSIATGFFVLAGLRVIGVNLVPMRLTDLVTIGAVALIVLLVYFQHFLTVPGLALDLLVVAMVSRWLGLDSRCTQSGEPRHRWRARIAIGASALFLVYTTSVILLRPWFMTWGTTAADRSVTLFGDSLDPSARDIVNNAVTILAPADSVWPWVAQMGQDRAGFYSYSHLENWSGADITNADSIVPQWQYRQVGDFVRAVPSGWFGGRFGRNLGWRIIALEPGRALLLENWGAFVVRPIDATTTRMHIRQRNPGAPGVVGTIFAPAGLLVFEPAHFIMQRGMLLGIKKRAEHQG